MTDTIDMPRPELREAVDAADGWASSYQHGFMAKRHWETIRAELLRLAAVETELAALKAKMQWQPIKTAPRIGRNLILLLTPSGWPQVAYSDTWHMAGFSVECKPTYWLPLPEPPAERGEG